MTEPMGTPQYYRYQPPEGLVYGEPDWLQPGRCYEGAVPARITGCVLLFEPGGEGFQGVHAHQVVMVTEEEYREDRPVGA